MLVDVRDAVVVRVDLLPLFGQAVLAVPRPQHHRGQHRREKRRRQDAHLGVVVVRAALAEAEFATSRDTVKPIPASRETPKTSIHLKDPSSRALVVLVTTHVVPMMPSGLPSTSATMMPMATGSVKARAQPFPAADGHAGGEEGEDGHGHSGGDGAEPVLEDFGEARSGFGAAAGPRPEHRHGESQQHPGHRGVDAGGVHQRPRGDAERQENGPGSQGTGTEEAAVSLRQEGVQRQRDEGQQQRGGLDVAGVEERDDADGNQVIHHGQGEQEDAQGARQVRTDDGQHGHGERDVRGRGDGPAAQGLRGCRC